jgi:hypothetical protein
VSKSYTKKKPVLTSKKARINGPTIDSFQRNPDSGGDMVKASFLSSYQSTCALKSRKARKVTVAPKPSVEDMMSVNISMEEDDVDLRSQPTTTIGQCGGEPDPLDDKLPETEASQQTSKGNFTIHIEICPTDDVPSDAEELNAYEWAMDASIADAATRTSLMLSQPGGGGSMNTTTMLSGTTTTLPIGMGRYSASRRGSEESSPQDLKQVNRPVTAPRQTVLSVRPCFSNSRQAVLPKRLPELSEQCTVSGTALSSPAHDVWSNVASAVSPNLDSALGAVLDDDEVRACKGTVEAEGNLLASHQHNICLGNLLASHQHNNNEQCTVSGAVRPLADPELREPNALASPSTR